MHDKNSDSISKVQKKNFRMDQKGIKPETSETKAADHIGKSIQKSNTSTKLIKNVDVAISATSNRHPKKRSLLARKSVFQKGVDQYLSNLKNSDSEGVEVVIRGTQTTYRVSESTQRTMRKKLQQAKVSKAFKENISAAKAEIKNLEAFTEKLSSSIEKDKEKLEKLGDEITHLKQKKLNKTQKKLLNEKEASFEKGKKAIAEGEELLEKKTKKLGNKKQELSQLKKDQKKFNSQKSSLNKLKSFPLDSIKGGLGKYQEELESGDTEGVKVVSQGFHGLADGVKGSKKLIDQSKKVKAALSKTSKHKSKLSKSNTFGNRSANGSVDQAKTLKNAQKRSIKKKMYYGKSNMKSKARATSKVSQRLVSFFKNNKVSQLFKGGSIVGKIAGAFGGGGMLLLPILLITIILMITTGLAGGLGSEQQNQSTGSIGASKNLSPDVEKWRSLVEQEAAAEGMSDYVSLILALMQVESGGKGTRDIMQSSESAGFPVNYWQTEQESVRQAVKYLKSIVNLLQGYNQGYEKNAKLLAQAYNFGAAFATYVGKNGGVYTIDVAEKYSRDVVAPSLGNHTGRTYSYVNDVSVSLGKTYLYWNGGNYLYGELVAQYIGGSGLVTGDFKIVLEEIEKYNGWTYVFGGKNPQQGFDCSGIVSWGLSKIGISLPSYTVSQWEQTDPVSLDEAQPGDLIFFRGTYQSPDFISHIEFYIDGTTMYGSNSSGVGYHDWSAPYWQQHFAGIRRVRK